MNELFYEFDDVHRKVLSARSAYDIYEQTLRHFLILGERETSFLEHPSFYLLEEDFGFSLRTKASPSEKKEVESIIQQQVEKGALAWALKQNRINIIELPEHPRYRQMVTHSLFTPEKTYGIFIGFVKKGHAMLSILQTNLISILMNSVASRLDSIHSHEQLATANQRLQSQVDAKTQKLMLINQGLEKQISNRKEAEQQLRATQSKLMEASQVKSQFLSLVSHELRTPLVPVVSLSEMLRDTLTDESQREMCEIVNASAQHLLRMMEDILELSQMNYGDDRPHKEPQINKICIVPFVRDSLEFFEKQALQKGLRFEVVSHLPPDVFVLVASAQLRQILFHLVGNAVKFTSYGSVRVKLEKNFSGNILVSIIDTGIGIEQHNLERIFDPFVQVDSSHSRKFVGAGLGLSIARSLARSIGVELAGQSVYGKGSTFTITVNAY